MTPEELKALDALDWLWTSGKLPLKNKMLVMWAVTKIRALEKENAEMRAWLKG